MEEKNSRKKLVKGKIDVKKVVEYWEKTADLDYKTMLYLFKGKRYASSLFFGHIILEKIFKGLVVQKTEKQAPYIHNLIELAELTKCNLSEEEMKILDRTNKFNIRCRYPDYKLNFYKQYNNLKYSTEKFNEIKKLYKKLCQELKQRMKRKK